MIKLKVKILFILSLCTSVFCYSQVEDTVNNMPTFHRELAGQIFVHTGGYGVNLRRSYHVTAMQKRFFEIDLTGMSHPKSITTPSSQITDSKSFVFGQLNSALLLRAGYGMHKVLAGKTTKSNVEIRLVYAGGLSLCVLKPSYFEIDAPGSNKVVYEKYSQTNKNYIKGGAPFGLGFYEISLLPGAYGKVALSFEYGGSLQRVRAIETGLNLDLYYKAVPLLADTKNYPFFVSVYVGLVYGKKWYR
ncbi:MAG: hypothetical protein ACKOXB_05845 [Flavobacteriales bacterium]